jgi:hypothetical protein
VILAGTFLVAAIWSAWRQVDPLAGLQRMTDQQWLLTQLSMVSPDVVYFSPRHALAGAAVILLAGPSSVFQAIGLWTYRMPADQPTIDAAARLLAKCETVCPIEEIRAPEPAFLLRRLALIKVVPQGNSTALTVTEKGSRIVGKVKGRKSKPAAE